MPEPLTIVAGTLSIVNGAITATVSLINFIDSIKNAPNLVIELRKDVEATKSVVQAIEELIKTREGGGQDMPPSLRACLSSADRTLEDCKVVSVNFELKLKKWFNDSMWDRLKPTFKNAKIERFRNRLRDTRDVLGLTLNVCTIKFHGIEANEARTTEAKFDEQLQQLSGELRGLEIGRQEILSAADSVNDQHNQVLQEVSQQHVMIAKRLFNHECLIREAIKLCAAGLDETTKKTGNNVKLVKTLDTARILVAQISGDGGDIGGGIDIGEIIAAGNSRIVGFTNNADFALKFLE